jgi:hypothetical protein
MLFRTERMKDYPELKIIANIGEQKKLIEKLEKNLRKTSIIVDGKEI